MAASSSAIMIRTPARPLPVDAFALIFSDQPEARIRAVAAVVPAGLATRPLLVGRAVARPDDERGAVGGAVAGHVEALAGSDVDDRATGLDAPLLRGGPGAVV